MKDDTVSRAAAIDEAEEWIEVVYCEDGDQRERDAIGHVIHGIKELPSIPTCDDAVSRQAAIDAAKDWYEGLICGSVNGLIKKLKALPTVPPGAHEGKWVYGEDSTADCVDGYRCSQCGFFVPWDYNHKLIDYINDYAYCPNCGARMKGASE